MIEPFFLNFHQFVFDQAEQILLFLFHLFQLMMEVEDIL
jgi:hypothetical protein